MWKVVPVHLSLSSADVPLNASILMYKKIICLLRTAYTAFWALLIKPYCLIKAMTAYNATAETETSMLAVRLILFGSKWSNPKVYICIIHMCACLLNRPSEQTKTKQRFSLLVSFKLDCVSLPQYCSLFPRVQTYCFQAGAAANLTPACRLWLKSFAYRSQTFLTGLIRP